MVISRKNSMEKYNLRAFVAPDMAVRFTRVVGLYTFFSVFLPGMMFILGVLPLAFVVYYSVTGDLSTIQTVIAQFSAVSGVLVFVTLGMFAGFGLHTLGALLDKKLGGYRVSLSPLVGLLEFLHLDAYFDLEDAFPLDSDLLTIRIEEPHRKLFRDMLNKSNDITTSEHVSAFLDAAHDEFPYLGLRSESGDASDDTADLSDSSGDEPDNSDGNENDQASRNEDDISKETADALYTLTRSQIHMDQSGRSRTFQSVFASSRTMFAGWILLSFTYTLLVSGMAVVTIGIVDGSFPLPDMVRQALSTGQTTQNLFAALASTVIVSFVGMYGFGSVARSSKRYYLEYLISDFLLLHDGGDANDSERTADQDSPSPRNGSANR